MLVRLFRRHPREWGPVEWLAVLGLVALTAAVIALVVSLLRGPGPCGDELEEIGGDCVGVTEGVFEADPEVASLIRAVADENARVRKGWEDPSSGPRIPYVRIALMMPFTADEHSAMTTDMIRRGLAGALTAQRQANSFGGPRYQLLLAPDGRNLDAWEPVVERLAELSEETATPLVGVTGIPSSTPETRDTIRALSKLKIPTVGPVITSADMNSTYFFKTSPNNDQFTRALKLYLDRNPADRKGFLVWDNRDEDVYSKNLRAVFERHFNDTYDLSNHSSNFIGSSGTARGIPQRFTDAVQKICNEKSDTVFFAGRDQDLPAFVARLAQEGTCGRTSELRILKVGIGLEPTLTTDESTRWLEEARATIVDASAVDPRWWAEGPSRRRRWAGSSTASARWTTHTSWASNRSTTVTPSCITTPSRCSPTPWTVRSPRSTRTTPGRRGPRTCRRRTTSSTRWSFPASPAARATPVWWAPPERTASRVRTRTTSGPPASPCPSSSIRDGPAGATRRPCTARTAARTRTPARPERPPVTTAGPGVRRRIGHPPGRLRGGRGPTRIIRREPEGVWSRRRGCMPRCAATGRRSARTGRRAAPERAPVRVHRFEQRETQR